MIAGHWSLPALEGFVSRWIDGPLPPALRGRLGSVAGSVSKLLLVETVDVIGRLLADLCGPSVFLDEDETFLWSEFVLGAPSLHIAGGTDEIQRNVIAQRGLGLPR